MEWGNKMKCKYCEAQIKKGDFCSTTCRTKLNENTGDALETLSPRIIAKQLSDNEVKMQEKFLKKNRKGRKC